jgi:hypothetical protein
MADPNFPASWFPQPSPDAAISGGKNLYWTHALLTSLHPHAPPMPWLLVSEFKPEGKKKIRENLKLIKDYLVFITNLLQPQTIVALFGISQDAIIRIRR